jgi:hypothetical protein
MSQCAAAVGIKYNPIRKCAEGTEGDELLAALGDRTHSLTPHLTFVPTVTINDVSIILIVTNLCLNKLIIKLLFTVNSIKMHTIHKIYLAPVCLFYLSVAPDN